MKKYTLLLFLVHAVYAFPQFSDNFNDGRFMGDDDSPRNIEWTGDIGNFIVNESLQLQLDAPAEAASSQLKTPSSRLKNTAWEFYIQMDFTLTASNYARIYLAGEEENLLSEQNSLFVRIGHTDKNVCLMQSRRGATNKTLIAGESKRFAENRTSVHIKVTLDKNNNLKLYSRLDNEDDFILEGSCRFTDEFAAAWFGIVCTYTKTRNNDFFFDDFVIRELREEEQEPEEEQPEEHFPGEGDIVFSEIMANPVGNTNEYPEYIELYNTTDKVLHLGRSYFCYGDKELPLVNCMLPPYSYIILCKTTSANLFEEGAALGVTSFPTLANKGKLLMLKDKDGALVSWFEYSDVLYGDAGKKTGGWSLECIDLLNRSNTNTNWTASTDESGGTPGKPNSVMQDNPDTVSPQILSYSNQELLLTVRFSKPMDKKLLLNKEHYAVHSPLYHINSIETNYPQGNEIVIEWNQIPEEGDTFELELKDMKDINGNNLLAPYITIGYASEAEPGDIVINELLFNAPAGGEEYVELYNRSGKTLDLRFLNITSRKPSDGSYNKFYPLASLPLFLYPQEYLLITKSSELVCRFFRCKEESFFAELPVMPPIANASGCVVILNNKEEIIDEFAYNEKMHAGDIKNKKGVSLERVDYDKPSGDTDNWRSASAGCGYGTPGYENSCNDSSLTPENGSTNKITVEYPAAGSSYYRIHYELDKHGYLGRLLVFDTLGRLTDVLLDNVLLDKTGTVSWENRKRTSANVYIIYMEVTNQAGEIRKLKTAVIRKD